MHGVGVQFRAATALTAAREVLGPEPVIGIDIHHRYSVAEAASFCNKLRPDTLDFVEEPIRDETPEAYAELRKMTNIPFAIGEEFASKWQFLPYIERGIANFARIDLCNVGGFTEAMKVAGWCEAHYIDMMPHNPLGPISTAANLHFAAAVPNYAWLEERTGDLVFGPDYFPVQQEIEHTDVALVQGLTAPFPKRPALPRCSNNFFLRILVCTSKHKKTRGENLIPSWRSIHSKLATF